MSTSTEMDEHERKLLAAATSAECPRRIPALLRSLRPAFAFEPAPLVFGLGVNDEERGLFVHHVLALSGDAELDGEEIETLHVPAEASGMLRDPSRERGAVALDPARHPGNEFLESLAARGVARLHAAPLYFDRKLLGCVFVGEGAGAGAPGLGAYLEQLARIVEPRLWNCFTDERFARGDRRRDALWELSRVINTSLEPRVVIHLALKAIAGVEGHRASWIGLLDEGGRSWRRHERAAGKAEEPGDPAPRPVQGTVLERILADPKTFESGDLARETRFRGDEELLARGARRFLATPLSAGGKLLGALLVGTDDPHPPLRVDVWLVENAALQVALAIDNAEHHQEVQRLSARREREAAYLREEIEREHGAQGMIGRSSAMRAVFETIARVARTDSTVLISGPTGVGKELVARAIHEASRVKDRPLVKLNCAAIPEGMVESELFGHERGAFTSAVDRRIGRFELAQDGTLFLDEVGELPLAVQAKLLRVLQNGEFERVGGSKTLCSRARIVAATNRDLSKAVEGGTFRSDLYYRLNVFPIEVPPLDERREDVPLLAAAFVEQLSRRMGKRIDAIDPASLEHLRARSWPGNVRELRHVIERAMILSDGPVLAIDEAGAGRRAGAVSAAPGESTLREAEAEHIRAALARTGGVVEGPRGAAALLGLRPSTLRFRMKRLGVERPSGGA